MDGKVVFEGNAPDATPFVIRYPKLTDTQAMLDYINTLSKEQTFIRYQGEELTLEYETEHVKELLKKINEHKAIRLLVFSHNRLIGAAGIERGDRVHKHTGSFHLGIAKEYRGRGIGTILMEQTINEAKNQFEDLRIVTLGVFANNTLAVAMYEKFGFKEFGLLPEGIIYKGDFVDYTYMYKKVR